MLAHGCRCSKPVATKMKPDQEANSANEQTPAGEPAKDRASPADEAAVGEVDQAAASTRPEDQDPPGEAPSPSCEEAKELEEATPEQMAAEIEALKAALSTEQDKVLRGQAELENLRKRLARDVENARKFGLEPILTELLPVRDSLELGLAAAGDDGVEIASVREGLELTLKMLDTATGKFGLAEVDPLGQAFDPERHQAISMQEVAGTESGTVLNVIQKGFTLNDRLVRPAMVIVAS